MKKIKDLRHGGQVIFDRGKFDDYCVYVVRGGVKHAPHDETYFTDLQIISNLLGNNKVYDDFLLIYEKTWAVIEKSATDLIESIADTYPPSYKKIIEEWFTVIYAGMVAEEVKENARLRKRIKRLGMYQTLIEKRTANYAAKFSYNKNWMDLNKIMKNLGF